MPNGISCYSQLVQYISVLRVMGGIFHIFLNFNRTFCKKTGSPLIICRIVQRLIWVCTVLPMSHKKDARLIWVNPCPFVGHRQNSADSDQTSDQGLPCLLTEYSYYQN